MTHSFLKRQNNEIVPVKGSDLKVGDRIPIAKFIPVINNPITEYTYEPTEYTFTLDKDFGWLCGAYIADGRVHGHKITISKIADESNNR